MHTAQHLVEHCLGGDLARGRTIILATHHVAFCLPVASYLVEIEQGKLIRQASIQELRDQGILSAFVKTQDIYSSQEHGDTHPKQNEADALGINDTPKMRRQPTDGKLIEAETRAEGRVSTQTYMTYIRAAGLLPWFITIVLLLLIRFINIGNQVCSVFYSLSTLDSRSSPVFSSAVGRSISGWFTCSHDYGLLWLSLDGPTLAQRRRQTMAGNLSIYLYSWCLLGVPLYCCGILCQFTGFSFLVRFSSPKTNESTQSFLRCDTHWKDFESIHHGHQYNRWRSPKFRSKLSLWRSQFCGIFHGNIICCAFLRAFRTLYCLVIYQTGAAIYQRFQRPAKTRIDLIVSGIRWL